MKKLGLIALALMTFAGCEKQTTNSNLEKKVDTLTADIAEIKQMLKAGGGRGGPAGAAGQAQQPRRPAPDPTKTYAVDITGLPFEGPADAKVTIVKGYEYACPYCEKVRPTLDEIKKKYGADVKIVYKQFVVHPTTATAPSLAACASHRQGKFSAMEPLLWEKIFKARKFDADKCWTSDAGCPALEEIAKEAGLDVGKFKSDMKECTSQIAKEQSELQKVGVGGTPAFFINGRYLSGAQPVDAFSRIIDEELKKASDRIAQGTSKSDYYKVWVMEKGLKQLEAPAPAAPAVPGAPGAQVPVQIKTPPGGALQVKPAEAVPGAAGTK